MEAKVLIINVTYKRKLWGMFEKKDKLTFSYIVYICVSMDK